MSAFYPILVFLVVMSRILGLSCSSYMIFWFFIELNLLSFLGALTVNFRVINKGESLLYLVVQGVASIFILSCLIAPFLGGGVKIRVLLLAVLTKLAAAPVHLWYFWIIQRISWDLFFLVSTVQKLLPLLFLRFFTHSYLFYLAAVRATVGAVGALVRQALTQLMGYSSLLIIGWFLPLRRRVWVLIVIFFVYTINLLILVRVFQRNGWERLPLARLKIWSQAQGLNLSIGLFRFIGVPPTLGFLGKYVRLVYLLSQNLRLPLILLLSSGAILWVYTKILFRRWKQYSLGRSTMLLEGGVPLYWILLLPRLRII